MDLFGGKRTDKAQESKRIKDIQQLIRDVAGDVDDECVDVTEVREMMRAKQAAETKKVEAAPTPTPRMQPAIELRKTEPIPVKGNVPDATGTNKVPEDGGLKLPPKGYIESIPEDKRIEPAPQVKIAPAPDPKSAEPVLDAKKAEPEKRRSYEPVFCIYCGTRLAEDGSGCPKCSVKKAGPTVGMPVSPSPVPPQPPRTVPVPSARERPVFCIYCGSRLPQDGSGCAKCFSQRWRRCQSCGAWVRATDISCPVCHRVLSVETGRKDERYMRH